MCINCLFQFLAHHGQIVSVNSLQAIFQFNKCLLKALGQAQYWELRMQKLKNPHSLLSWSFQCRGESCSLKRVIYELGSKGGRDSDRAEKEEEKEILEKRNIISKGKGLGCKIPRDMVFSPVSFIITVLFSPGRGEDWLSIPTNALCA